MDTDLILVIGIVLCVLAIPSLLAAFAESRGPRSGVMLVTVGGILVVVALTQSVKSYSFAGLPQVFVSVISRLVN